MPINNLSSLAELERILSGSKTKLSVIDFYATWCGPCRIIAPKFESLSNTHLNVNFLKCDVDNLADVARKYNVTAMPTFVFLKGSTEVQRIKGVDANALESAIKTHATATTGEGGAAFSGKGHTLGGPSSSSSSNSSAPPQPLPSFPNPSNLVTNLDPQIKILLALVGGYILLWYMTSS